MSEKHSPLPSLSVGHVEVTGPDGEPGIPYDEAVIYFDGQEEFDGEEGSVIIIKCPAAYRLAHEFVRAVNGLPEAIAALEPFAEMFLEGSEDFGDDVGITCTGGRTSDFTLTIGDFRRARAALAKLEAEP